MGAVSFKNSIEMASLGLGICPVRSNLVHRLCRPLLYAGSKGMASVHVATLVGEYAVNGEHCVRVVASVLVGLAMQHTEMFEGSTGAHSKEESGGWGAWAEKMT